MLVSSDEHGVVLIQGLFSQGNMSKLIAVSRFAFRAFADPHYRQITGIDEEKRLCQSYDHWRGLGMDHLLPYLSRIKPGLAVDLRKILELLKVTASRNGHELLLSHCFFRRCLVDDKGHVPWHCDAEAVSLWTWGRPAFTVWMPLEPVGTVLPSLEFVIGSHRIMEKRDDLVMPQHRSDEFVDALPGARLIPVIDHMGDGVIFDQFMLHRTERMKADQPRHSCEFRFLQKVMMN